MGSKAQAPAAPDYTPLIKASQDQAAKANDLQQQQFDWAKNQYAADKVTSDKVSASATANMDQSTAAAKASQDRYNNVEVPLQDQYIKQAQDYNSPGRTDANMGAAQGAVATQFDAARTAAQQSLESYGINPSATRFAALDIGTRTQQAAATAAAGTTAARTTEATGRELLGNAINMGAGLSTQAEGQLAGANASGGAATGANLNQTASGANTMGTSAQYSGIATGAIGGAMQGMNDQATANTNTFNANQNASSGWGSALGLAAGIGGKMLINHFVPGFKNGGAIPVAASPSNGAVPDDINAKLSGGEFVMPADTVRWLGEKALYGMIDKAKTDRAGGATGKQGAIPTSQPITRLAA
jgi:hypothetical protein